MPEASRSGRRFSAFGTLDKKARRWADLPPVRQSTGEMPDGDELVYAMNARVLEIGQGTRGLRGYLALPFLVAGLTGTLFFPGLAWHLLTTGGGWNGIFDAVGLVGVLAIGLLLLLVFAAGVLCLVLCVNDMFGYVDAPVRFDRVSRKVFVWHSRRQGPMVLDWDCIKPVAQAVSAPPYQVNEFRSVLLVDEDENGEVRFEGGLPRIAQAGAAVLNRRHALQAYEYVRTFMELGPTALPTVKTYLLRRPLGWRNFVDIFGICGGALRSYPSLPADKKRPGWLLVGVLAGALLAVVAWPLQLVQGLVLRFTGRIASWPAEYERLAQQAGSMGPPYGAAPDDAPLLPHERVITGFWVLSAVSTYAAWAAAAF